MYFFSKLIVKGIKQHKVTLRLGSKLEDRAAISSSPCKQLYLPDKENYTLEVQEAVLSGVWKKYHLKSTFSCGNITFPQR